MKTTAAILVELKKPLVLTEIEIPPLKPGQTLVEIEFSGVCHTQILECRGYRGEDRFLPHCLGHEGSGTVVDAGPGVTLVKPGDKVILSWMKGPGADVPGTVYDWDGRKVNAGGITTFSRLSVISENRLTPLPGGVSMMEAALIGCAAPTGLGAVFNVARAGAGNSVAVFGAGGVGLCAVAGAAAAGCNPIIAVDVLPNKLELATRMGATHTVSAAAGDPVAEILRMVPGGVDFAVESSGRPDVMLQAVDSVRAQGGAAVIIGNARHGEKLIIDPGKFNQGKSMLGTWGGNNSPARDFPKYCALVAEKKLNLLPLITKVYPLEEINGAIDDLEAGKVIRPVISMRGDGLTK